MTDDSEMIQAGMWQRVLRRVTVLATALFALAAYDCIDSSRIVGDHRSAVTARRALAATEAEARSYHARHLADIAFMAKFCHYQLRQARTRKDTIRVMNTPYKYDAELYCASWLIQNGETP